MAEAIKGLNFDVTTNPPHRLEPRTWGDRISSWLKEPTHSLPRPDLLVEHDGKVALVEVKAYPVLLGSVIQARHYADYYGAPIMICVPDDAFDQIPGSVRESAETNAVILSPIRELDDNLKSLLQKS